MRTLVLEISYDGSNYAGWQIQKNVASIQEHLENALEKISKNRYKTVAAGRTDASVHAFAQIVSVELLDSFSIPEEKIIYALNTNLPFDIRINKVKILNEKFNARFDANFREYKYFITNKYNIFERNYCTFTKYPLDLGLLNETANIFIKKTDFTTFSKYNPDNNNPVCDVVLSYWEYLGDGKFIYTVKSNHFLYGMVRSLVGTMLDIIRGKRSLENINFALNQKDRSLNSPLAKPQGLFLNKVYYTNEIFL